MFGRETPAIADVCEAMVDDASKLMSANRGLVALEGAAPAPVRAMILRGALRHANRNERADLLLSLAQTGQPDGLAEVVRHWEMAGGQVHRAALEQGEAMDEAFGVLLAGPTLDVQRAMQVLDSHPRIAILPAVTRLAGLCDPERLDEVSALWLRLVISAVGRNGKRRVSARTRADLDREVVIALSMDRRRRNADILAGCALASVRAGAALAKVLGDWDHETTRTLRGVLEHDSHPIVRANQINWLGVDWLARGVERRWPLAHVNASPARPTNREKIGRSECAWSEGRHLLSTQSRRLALRRVPKSRRNVPDVTVIAGHPEAERAAVRLAGLVPWRDRDRVAYWAQCDVLECNAARMAALIELLARTGPAASAALERFRDDPDRHIGAVACRRDVNVGGLPELKSIEVRGHEGDVRRARARMARESVRSFGERVELLAKPQRTAALRVLLRRDPENLVKLVRGMLARGSHTQRMCAINLTEQGGLVDEASAELVGVARSDDTRAASAAIAALGSGTRADQIDEILRALWHADARVRANAIEALGKRRGETALEAIDSFRASADNRTRANAVRVEVKSSPEEGLGDLARMLRDDRPLHRVSGLWVARRAGAAIGGGDLMVEVRRLAEVDELTEVRRRAASVVSMLHRFEKGAGDMHKGEQT